ncbi:MAG: transposase [Caldilineales bacterium]
MGCPCTCIACLCPPDTTLGTALANPDPADQVQHYVCSVTEWTQTETIRRYDDRGACETEIQADKMGLKLERRRKKHLVAQEALVLLVDLAHNLLAWTCLWMALPAPLSSFGALRLVEDVFCMPGRLVFSQNRLVEVQLSQSHPYANAIADGLQHLLARFGDP